MVGVQEDEFFSGYWIYKGKEAFLRRDVLGEKMRYGHENNSQQSLKKYIFSLDL